MHSIRLYSSAHGPNRTMHPTVASNQHTRHTLSCAEEQIYPPSIRTLFNCTHRNIFFTPTAHTLNSSKYCTPHQKQLVCSQTDSGASFLLSEKMRKHIAKLPSDEKFACLQTLQTAGRRETRWMDALV